jgi:hypothetical protein
MMEVVDEQARQRGITAVDWIRHAIAFTFEEETNLREHLRTSANDRPIIWPNLRTEVLIS